MTSLNAVATSEQNHRRYAILGTGAVGGYYGACLQRAGQDVHFLLHRDIDHVQANGLRIDSIKGNFTLPRVQAYRRTQDIPPVDVAVIALKTTQNLRLLPEILPPLVGPNTVILTLQNGLGIEGAIAAIAPEATILSGLCFICSNKVGPGHIHHLDYGSLLMGVYDSRDQPVGLSPELKAVAQDFIAAGLTVDLTEDLYLARWRKLVWNIPFNGLSVVLNATTADMMAHPNSRQLAADLMAEVLTAAKVCARAALPGSDRALDPAIMAAMLENTTKMKPYRTSMKIDFDEGRPLEVEAIFGNPLRAAQQAGTPVPRIETLYHQLKALDPGSTLR